MMGGHHAASGAAAWVAVTASTPIAFGWYEGVTNTGVIAGALVWLALYLRDARVRALVPLRSAA